MFTVYHEDTHEHVKVCGCACLSTCWCLGRCYLQAVLFFVFFFFCIWMEVSDSPLCPRIKSLATNFSPSFSYFHLRRKTQASVCLHFLSQIQPSSPHVLLLTVLFEQLQQGNVSTAFQAQALCGYVSVFYQAFRCINTQTGSTLHALEAKYQHHSSS